MRTIQETFTDEEHKGIEDKKNALELTWHDFLLLFTYIDASILNDAKTAMGKTRKGGITYAKT